MPERRSRTVELTKQYRWLRTRYGVKEPRSELARIDVAMKRRRFRIQHLQEQLAEIQDQMQWLESELEGYDKAMELVLMDAIEKLRRAHPEAWSPFPVLGYRLWVVDLDGFHGIRQTWHSPTFVAHCLTTNEDDGVPHTDGRCGFPPCGIYATKSVRYLLTGELPDHTGRMIAVGLVEMSGKVVEHVRGYRAARAAVVALVLLRGPANPLLLDDPGEIESLFRDVSLGMTLRTGLDSSQEDPMERAITYLEARERSHEWTSAKKNE
jgi:hypothetical protein